MVFVGNGTPEGDGRARLLNQRSIGPDEQTRTAIREFYFNLEYETRMEFRAYLKLRTKVEHGMRFARLRQGLAMSVVNRRENSAVMQGGRKVLPTLGQLLAIVNEIDPLD